MASVNKVIVLGHLGRDPELKSMKNGDTICNIAIATSRKWKDKQGEKQEETEWHRVSAFGRTADVIGEYCKKGSALYVEGRLKTRKWQDKDGADRYTTEIIADSVQLMGKSGGGDEAAPAPAAPKKKAPAGFEDFDDDIPF